VEKIFTTEFSNPGDADAESAGAAPATPVHANNTPNTNPRQARKRINHLGWKRASGMSAIVREAGFEGL